MQILKDALHMKVQILENTLLLSVDLKIIQELHDSTLYWIA